MSRFDVEKFDSPLVCCICRCVFEGPVESPCRHVFCKICIETWLQFSNRNCPTCRHPLNKEHLKPTSIVQNMLNHLLMVCDFQNNGCQEKIPLKFYDKHINACDFKLMPCKYEKCSASVLRKFLTKHEEEECEEREKRCNFLCGQMIPVRIYDNHDCMEELRKNSWPGTFHYWRSLFGESTVVTDLVNTPPRSPSPLPLPSGGDVDVVNGSDADRDSTDYLYERCYRSLYRARHLFLRNYSRTSSRESNIRSSSRESYHHLSTSSSSSRTRTNHSPSSEYSRRSRHNEPTSPVRDNINGVRRENQGSSDRRGEVYSSDDAPVTREWLPERQNAPVTREWLPERQNAPVTREWLPGRQNAPVTREWLPGRQNAPVTREWLPGRQNAPVTREWLPGRQNAPDTREWLPGRQNAPVTREWLPGRQNAQVTREWLPGRQNAPDTREWLPGRQNAPVTREWLPGRQNAQVTREWLPGRQNAPDTREWLPERQNAQVTREWLPGRQNAPGTREWLPGRQNAPVTREWLPGRQNAQGLAEENRFSNRQAQSQQTSSNRQANHTRKVTVGVGSSTRRSLNESGYGEGSSSSAENCQSRSPLKRKRTECADDTCDYDYSDNKRRKREPAKSFLNATSISSPTNSSHQNGCGTSTIEHQPRCQRSNFKPSSVNSQRTFQPVAMAEHPAMGIENYHSDSDNSINWWSPEESDIYMTPSSVYDSGSDYNVVTHEPASFCLNQMRAGQGIQTNQGVQHLH